VNKKHIGSNFDDFLREEHLLDAIEAIAAGKNQKSNRLRMNVIVTSQGRITIPIEIRKKLGIKDKTRFQVIDTGDSIVLKPITKAHASKPGVNANKSKI
jgi:AbrB family looped-hinge helix DNA binding protein